MVSYLGTVQGHRPLWPPARHLPQDAGRRVRSPAPSNTRAARAARHQEGTGCWKLLGAIDMKWKIHRGGMHPLGLWTTARSLPEILGCQVTRREGRRVGPCGTLMRALSRLVRKLGCVKSLALVKNSRQLLRMELVSSSGLTLSMI